MEIDKKACQNIYSSIYTVNISFKHFYSNIIFPIFQFKSVRMLTHKIKTTRSPVRIQTNFPNKLIKNLSRFLKTIDIYFKLNKVTSKFI